MTQKIDTNKYCDCLYEINQRIKVIAGYLNFKYKDGVYKDEYMITIVEFLCLQFRKIIENISYLSLISNQKAISEINAKYVKYRKVNEIFADIEKINPKFFPTPVRREVVDADNCEYQFGKVEEQYLTKEKAIDIYEICGRRLHAINPFNPDFNYLSVFDDFYNWLTEIHILMSFHIVEFPEEKIMVSAILETSETGYPQAIVLSRVEDR